MTMDNGKFTQKIIQSLQQKAEQYPHKQAIMAQVLATIESKKQQRVINRWSMAGFALVAIVMGWVILPNQLLQQHTTPTAQSQKLSPQLADDLEMLMVLGEDTYGR